LTDGAAGFVATADPGGLAAADALLDAVGRVTTAADPAAAGLVTQPPRLITGDTAGTFHLWVHLGQGVQQPHQHGRSVAVTGGQRVRVRGQVVA
jgi:hypothetical protein